LTVGGDEVTPISPHDALDQLRRAAPRYTWCGRPLCARWRDDEAVRLAQREPQSQQVWRRPEAFGRPQGGISAMAGVSAGLQKPRSLKRSA
jgi:hypothetical protein